MKKSFFLFFLLLPFISNAQNQDAPLGINISSIRSWSPEYPFADVMKCSRTWVSQCPGCAWGTGQAMPMDTLGWITAIPANHWAQTLILDQNADKPTGIFNVFYEGTGTFRFGGDVIDTTHVASGHIQLEVGAGTGGISLIILTTDPAQTGDYLRNIRIIIPGAENTYQNQPFQTPFLKRWANYSCLRFMDWMDTNFSPVQTWSDRTRFNAQTQSSPTGIAPEYIFKLSNTLQANAWVCIPHQADDNYVTQLATLLRDSLDTNLKLYIEYSNEVWNYGFSQAHYAANQGLALGLSTNGGQAQAYYYSQRSSEIFAIFETVFGNTQRLERVVAWQNFNTFWSKIILDYNNLYQSTDALAIAPYFGNILGDPSTQNTVAAMSVDEILDICQSSLDFNMDGCRQQAVIAQARDIDLIAYEGGQHLVGYGGAENNLALEALFQAANRDPRMQDIYLEYLERWKLAGGKLFAVFASMSRPSKFGSWGVLETSSQTICDAPKYAAIQQFISKESPAWWLNPDTVSLPQGDALINFLGSDLPPLNVTFNRNFTVNPTDQIIPFSTADGDHLFNTGDTQSEFYGGIHMDFTPNTFGANTYLYTLSNNGTNDYFSMSTATASNEPSAMQGLFLWRKDQFLNNYDNDPNVTVGTLKANLIRQVSASDSLYFRFVIKNNGNYYLSDFMTWDQSGSFTLDLFNHSETPGKRWYPFNPTANNFTFDSLFVNPVPLKFEDVTEVGFLVKLHRFGYGTTFTFDSFEAYTRSSEEFSVTLNQNPDQPDYAVTEPLQFTAIFSDSTSNFQTGDVTIRGNATGAMTIGTVTEIAPLNGTTYNVAVTGIVQNGFIIVEIDSLMAANSNGVSNLKSTSKDNIISFKGATRPKVTINQTASQADPTSNTPIHFDVVFSAPVLNFDANDLVLSGTANPITAVVTELAPMNGTTYNIAVSGMTANGLVVASIPTDAVVIPIYGIGNDASTSMDNEVEFVYAALPSASLINFQGVAIPDSDFYQSRSLQLAADGLSEMIPFGIADGDHIFSSNSYNQLAFYGGAKLTYPGQGTQTFFQFRSNDTGFSPNCLWTSIGDSPSVFDLFFVWRKDQFLNNMNFFTIGFDNDIANSSLSINIVSVRENLDLRFVVKQNDIYYMSEYSINSIGLHTLTGFNNTTTLGNRWGVITPTSSDFAIPTPLPVFQAVNFNNIEAVGFIMASPRNAFSNNFTFDGFSVNGISITEAILPIELLKFNAKKQGESVLLQWETLSEINNKGFEIQKNANRHALNWEVIGFVQGKGMNASLSSYQFIDQNPFEGSNYYRLKQVDWDGNVFYSNIRKVDFITKNLRLRVYPNPTNDILTIEVLDNTIASIEILDAFGRIVRQYYIRTIKQIDISSLSQGTYFVRNKEEIIRIVKY